VTNRVGDAPAGIDAWRPSIAVTPDARIQTVWQDLREGTNRLRLASALGPDLEVGPSEVIDDAAEGAHTYAPRIAARGSELWVVWEDPRSGYSTVRLVRGP